ncbi:uncharacterized protein LOC131859004 [Cryptomeria japonica]|uniref:uncharacterized protein LOC131859004 n=1 Tax=Cryptomeria japonica TaxID=3369 RepID=UPI0027D9E36D|nr:uncharacterized protein LOC131859004 [Cryptomeria japonica]
MIIGDLKKKPKQWSSLFGIKPLGKCSLPPVSNTSDLSARRFSISSSDPIIDLNILLMALSLVGKFMGPRPNIETIRDLSKKKWKLNGQVNIYVMSKGFFVFSFSCEKDISTVLAGGPWVIGKSSLALMKWSLNLDLSDSIFEVVPVWVRLLGLPLEYWNEDVLCGIASSFGEILSIGAMTATHKRLVFARICVGVV